MLLSKKAPSLCSIFFFLPPSQPLLVFAVLPLPVNSAHFSGWCWCCSDAVGTDPHPPSLFKSAAVCKSEEACCWKASLLFHSRSPTFDDFQAASLGSAQSVTSWGFAHLKVMGAGFFFLPDEWSECYVVTEDALQEKNAQINKSHSELMGSDTPH